MLNSREISLSIIGDEKDVLGTIMKVKNHVLEDVEMVVFLVALKELDVETDLDFCGVLN